MSDNAPILDRVLGYLSPRWAAGRAEARARQEYFDAARRVVERHGLGKADVGMSYNGGIGTRTDSPYAYSSYSYSGVRQPSGASLRSMSERARHLVRNNTLASAMLEASASFVLGSGTRIEPMTSDAAFNTAAAELWDDWWYGRSGGSPDVRGIHNGPELERMLWTARLRDGDCGAILLGDGRLQAVESDIISTPDKRSADYRITDGVEIDARGRPLAFHLRTFAENAPLAKRDWARVEAQDFIYLPRLKRINQVRGETVFAQTFGLFDQIDGYIEAVVIAARMAAMFGLLIHEDTSNVPSLPTTKDGRGTDRPAFDMEPGMVKYTAGSVGGVTQIKPEQPTTQFEQFIVSLIRLSGLELALPLEVSLLDFSRTTYSSARAAMIVAQRAAMAVHSAWACRFISRVYRWRVSKWVKDGELPGPSDAMPWKHRAIQEPFAYLDPVKDVQGDMMAIDAGLTTLSDMLQARGTTLDEYVAKRSEELSKLESAGIEVSKSTSTRDDDTAEEPDDVQSQDEDRGDRAAARVR